MKFFDQMKLFLGILAFLLATSNSVHSQKSPIKFGKVSMEDLQMKNYPEDTSASAVILCDYGYFISSAFQFTRILRIKILKKEGSSLGTKVYPTNAMSLIKGITFNLEDGKITQSKLKNESVFPERVTEDYYRMRVAMPNVREGSVIDIMISYPGLPVSWKFQDLIPVKYSEIVIEQDPHVKFTSNISGSLPLSLSEPTRWIAEGMPAFKFEPLMNSEENYLTKIDFDIQEVNLGPNFQLTAATWDGICRILQNYRSFGAALEGSGYLNDISRRIEARTKSPLERLRMAYDTIKSEVRWDEKQSLITSNPSLAYVFKMKTGNSADINLMLVQLLKKLDIDVIPVLLSTRDNGILSPVSPSINKLNYVIAKAVVNDQTYFLDATEPFMPYYLLPLRSLNYRGQTYKSFGSEPVEINTTKKNKKIIIFDLTLNADNIFTGNMEILNAEYAAYDFRKKYSTFNSKEEFLEDYIKDKPGLLISSAEINNIDSLYLPVDEKYEIRLEGKKTVSNTELYLVPLLFDQIIDNPFKADTRKYPIDFGYNLEQTVITTITIPENYSVIGLPAKTGIKLAGNSASFIYETEKNGSTIRISGKFVINKTIFSPGDYQKLKEFYNQVIKKQTESVILKKI